MSRTGNAPPGAGPLLIHDRDPDLYLDMIEARFPDLHVHRHTSYDGLAEKVAEVRPRLVLSQKFAGVPYPRAPLVEDAGIEWVHVMGAGVDHLAPWDPGTVTVTNSAGIQAEVMAQYALAGVLAFDLDLRGFLRDQAAHRWAPREIRDARGQTLLVLGLGTIGRAVARHARAIGMRVTGLRSRAHDDDPDVERVHGPEDLHRALGEADVVVVLVPLTDATRGLLDADAIAAMKRGGVLVNMARGGIVDEEALAGALREGRLRGALLDVFASEPLPEDSPLWDLDDAILTPHVAAVFTGWERAAVEIFCDNLARLAAGEPLRNLVHLGRG